MYEVNIGLLISQTNTECPIQNRFRNKLWIRIQKQQQCRQKCKRQQKFWQIDFTSETYKNTKLYVSDNIKH